MHVLDWHVLNFSKLKSYCISSVIRGSSDKLVARSPQFSYNHTNKHTYKKITVVCNIEASLNPIQTQLSISYQNTDELLHTLRIKGRKVYIDLS